MAILDNNLYKEITDLKPKQNCKFLPLRLLKINKYGVIETTIITESKTDLILLLRKQRGEL